MISLSAIGVFRKNIPILGPNPEVSFENIFHVYTTENTNQQNFLYFNLLNTVHLPESLDASVFYTITVNKHLPWTAISYNEYRTIDLWWLIVLANKIDNPVNFPPPGSRLKIIKKEYVGAIIDDITTQLNKV